MWNQKGRLHALLMTGFLGTLLCGARASSADTYTVLNTNDSGAGSLRAAVASANGHAGADIVDFAPGVTGVITLTTGEISSTQALTVTGPGAASLELNGNSASRIINAGANLTLTGLTFRDGRRTGFGAGAVHVTGGLQASDCVFVNNTSVSGSGGAVYVTNGATLTHCTFTGNSGGGGGSTSGGALCVNSGGATLTNCTFTNNTRTGSGGGGAAVTGTLVMTGCTFTGNVCNGGTIGLGGGVAVASGSVTATNCSFNGNSSAVAGGALRTIGSPVSLTNCTFSGNSTGATGGGAVQVMTDSTTLTNCTITGNSSSFGGGLRLDAGPNVINNCIIWGNTATNYPQLFAVTAPVVSHSDIQGGGYPAMGNINQDPLFLRNPFTLGATDYGDLRLQAASPCYDTGSSALLPPDVADLDGDLDLGEPLSLDLAGNPRVFGAVVDMGAYEVMPALDVTAAVQVRVVRFNSNPSIQMYRYYVWVTNLSANPIEGPVSLALDSLPAGVSVINYTGFTSVTTPAGSPYVSANPTGGVLAPGQGVLLDVRLSSPTPLTSTLPSTQRVLAGPGPR